MLVWELFTMHKQIYIIINYVEDISLILTHVVRIILLGFSRKVDVSIYMLSYKISLIYHWLRSLIYWNDHQN